MQRHLRLRNRNDFLRLRKQGKTRHHPALTMSVTPNQLPHNRYGFIVSKRLGKAVIRNRIRRRLRACLSLYNTNMLSGYDVVFIARQPCLGLTYQEMCVAVVNLVKKAHLWSEPS